ncbi:MAG: sigma-70 family RNA polymerase sigma factor [Planctomycetaceae bacterium]
MPRTNGTSRRSWGESTYPGLIAGAAANSDTAWRTLVADYEPLLRYWCRRASLNDAAIDDVVQAVLLQLSQSLTNFKDDGRKASFRRWLRAITVARIADYLRQKRGPHKVSAGRPGRTSC